MGSMDALLVRWGRFHIGLSLFWGKWLSSFFFFTITQCFSQCLRKDRANLVERRRPLCLHTLLVSFMRRVWNKFLQLSKETESSDDSLKSYCLRQIVKITWLTFIMFCLLLLITALCSFGLEGRRGNFSLFIIYSESSLFTALFTRHVFSGIQLSITLWHEHYSVAFILLVFYRTAPFCFD